MRRAVSHPSSFRHSSMIDSHCHLADEIFEADLEQVVAAGAEAGLTRRDVHSCGRGRRGSRARGARPQRCGRSRPVRGRRPSAPGTRVRRASPAGPIGCFATHAPQNRRCARSARSASTTTTTSRRGTCSRRCSPSRSTRARVADLPVVIHTREADEDTFAMLASEGRGVARRVPLLHGRRRARPARARPRLLPLAGRHRDVPEGDRPARGRRPFVPTTACSSRPTARSWRPCRIAASATSPRGWRESSSELAEHSGLDREHRGRADHGRISTALFGRKPPSAR